MKKNEQNKNLIIEQLRKTPIVEVACQKIGISRMTFYRWKNEDKEFAKSADAAFLEGRSLVNDVAESQLISAVKDKNLPAITYWLRHHHADYGEKLQIKHALEDENLTPEQEALVREALRLATALYESNKIIKQQVNELQKTNSTGTGGSNDQRQESQSGDN